LKINQKIKMGINCFSIFGGPHPTFFPDMINENGVDAICIGEGEQAILDILENIDDIPKVLMLGDYFPGGSEYRSDEFMRKYKFDMVFGDQGQICDRVRNKKLCASTEFFHYSIDPEFFYDMGLSREFDVMATFASSGYIYPVRRAIREALHVENRIKSFMDKVVHKDYVEYINRSKMFISAKRNESSNVLWKFQEAIACGAMLLTTMPDNINEYRYEVGKHLVVYDDVPDMIDKILYYKENVDERLTIAKSGMDFVRQNYNNKVVIAEIIKKIVNFFNIEG